MKRILSTVLSLSLLAGLLTVPALAAEEKTLTLREDWRLTSDLDLNVPDGTTLTIDGNGFHIYEMGGKLLNSDIGTVTFSDGTILYPAANDEYADDITDDGNWDAVESAQLMALRQPTAYNITIDENIANGTVSADRTRAKAGATVTLDVDSDNYYALDSITVTEENSSTVSVDPDTLTFTMPASDVTVTATFKGHTTHTPASELSKDDTGHWYACSDNCYDPKVNYAEHSGGTATCTDKANCETCGQPYGNVAAHAWGQWTTTSTTHSRVCGTDASHTESAAHVFDNSSDTTCNTCGYTRSVSSGGGSSSGNSTTTTERNPDGSTTTTTTNKTTGAVTETTKYPDGSSTTVVTETDGTVTTTDKAADGSTVTTVEDPDGNVTAEATVSNKAGTEIVDDAVESGTDQVVIAPEISSDATKTEVSIPASTVGDIGSETNASLTVSTPVADVTIPNGGLSDLAHEGGTVTVTAEKTGNEVTLEVTAGGETVDEVDGGITLTVPHRDTSGGVVAVQQNADGSETVIKQSVPIAENGTVAIPLSGSATVVLENRSAGFADVAPRSTFADAIDFMSARSLMNGVDDGTSFNGSGTATRAMVWTILGRGMDEDLYGAGVFERAGEWAKALGISDGSNPNGYITRQQLATMLWRMAGEPHSDHDIGHFNDDHHAAGYAEMALRWAVEHGILTGNNGNLNPGGNATRNHLAAMYMRYVKAMNQ